ncbi:DUF2461 domain-containing protein [Mesonia sp. JHPTF-M18]|uniref:DUF2461 domain-containing protein n=2 Tax=Mesonia aestuariivivens TaxID=2796128 RepID=A0ABS6W4F9_9FLAO|nr:DUF2461 domain-containing protein [Mesonia aestuariivivens]MBW2962753.1 DUF2461 domain-containing protein [Mesonia aestuariivivens]
MKSVPQEALAFLLQLQKNNERDWFNEHKAEFKALESEMKDFYKEIEIKLNLHDQIEKTKAFRIYRDIRFSKDKTPYKTNFGASFTRRKPALRGGYYVHIQPENKSFIAVGFWNPHKDDLYRIRKEVELDAEEIKQVIQQKELKKYWGEVEGERLKTSPKGFDKEHPAIDLLNLKQWNFTKKFTDKEVLANDFAATVDNHFKAIRPFFDYMSSVLTTDLNGVSLIDE